MFCKCTWHHLGNLISKIFLVVSRNNLPSSRWNRMRFKWSCVHPTVLQFLYLSCKLRPRHINNWYFFASLILHKYRQYTRQIKIFTCTIVFPISKNSGLPCRFLQDDGSFMSWHKSHHFSAATLCTSNGSFTNCQGYRPLSVSQSVRDRCLHLQSSLEAELLLRVVTSGGRYIRIYVPIMYDVVCQLQNAGSPQTSKITPPFFAAKTRHVHLTDLH